MIDESGSAQDALRGVVFDAMPSQLAVLDAEGTIVETNEAWQTFGVDNGIAVDPEMIGENYLAVCRTSPDTSASEAFEGLSAILDGERERFSFEYPCHSPEEKRWFSMRAIPFEYRGERHVLVMHQDITDRRLAEAAVEDRNEALELVAGVISHDLRNPLTVALARLSMIEGDSEHHETLQRSLERMNDIIADALVITASGGVDELEPVVLSAVAEDAWEQVETDDAVLQLETSRTVQADRSLLAQLFENLFRNAIEHANGDSVTVTVGDCADGFFVTDDGPGIPADVRDQVFEPGFTTDKQGGTGLGLAIVRYIADAHDWTVEVTPSDVGARIEISSVDIE